MDRSAQMMDSRLLTAADPAAPGAPWVGSPMSRRAGYRSLVAGRQRDECLESPWHRTFQPETNRSMCRVLIRKLISIGGQPVPVATTRCYLIQMLRTALTCTNGCSCWSPD